MSDTDDITKFVAGVKKVKGLPFFSQAAREKMADDFIRLNNPKYQKRRYSDLLVALKIFERTLVRREMTNQFVIAINEGVSAILSTWTKEWVGFPVGDPDFSIQTTVNTEESSVDFKMGSGLVQIKEGTSPLNAVVGYPTAWPEFQEYMTKLT